MEKRELRILLGILTVSFALGICMGALMSARGGERADREIISFLTPLTQGTEYQSVPMTSLLTAFAYPLICFLLGLSLVGIAAIPLMFAGRALILSFAVGSCARAFGAVTGLLAAAAAMAPPLLLSLPCLFILGTQGMGTSLRLLSSAMGREMRVSGFSKRYFLRVAICIPPLLLSAAAELYVCPVLVKLVFSV